MPDIIKDSTVVTDNWTVWRESNALPSHDKVIVPLTLWLEQRDALLALGDIAVFLCNESPKSLLDDIDKLTLIAIDFPVFTDGRGFSYARELREQLAFSGELRAIGDFMRDQLFYLSRCGFNAFALENDDLHAALSSLKDFSETYQVSIDQPLPLFKRQRLVSAGTNNALPDCA